MRRGAQLWNRSVIMDKICAYEVIECTTLGGSSGLLYCGDRFNENSRVHNSEFLLPILQMTNLNTKGKAYQSSAIVFSTSLFLFL